jgi:cell fate (sporulation/competence/biofilm development) regulator YlbF (YheA/YmcA/DUF963 family)
MTNDELNKYLDEKLAIGAISFETNVQVRHEIRMRDAELKECSAAQIREANRAIDGESEVKALRAELDELKAVIDGIRDLARTGLPIVGYTPEMWAEHRLHQIASEANHALTAHGA